MTQIKRNVIFICRVVHHSKVRQSHNNQEKGKELFDLGDKPAQSEFKAHLPGWLS